MDFSSGVTRDCSDGEVLVGNEMTFKARLWLFIVIGGTGLFIIGSYLGFYYWPPIRRCKAIFCDPYHWQILAFGIAFFCAGLAYLIPKEWKRLVNLIAATLLVCLISGIVGSFAAR